MAEILESAPEQAGLPETERTEKVSYGADAAPEAPKRRFGPLEKWKAMPIKKRRRWRRRIIALVLIALVVIGAVKLFGKKGGAESSVVTDIVSYGSITSTVEGSGLTKAKNSETITISTAGTVQEVYVTEGQQVTAGEPLFVIDSPAARTAVQTAQSQVNGYQKQLAAKEKAIAGLNLAVPYAGKLMETVKLQNGDPITEGTKVALLVDDTRMRLQQYYSYAYKGEVKAGQTASVSIPALMSTLSGTVESVHMVNRITPEGSQLFEAVVVVNNPGTLTAEMVASATLTSGGETVYPYESGKLEYYRSTEVKSTVNGTVLSSNLVDYLSVGAGQVLVNIDGEDSENEIFTIQQQLETAQKTLDTAQKNLNNCNAVAAIDGTVIGLTITPGQELDGTAATVATIQDTSAITVNAMVDERNISYIKPGIMVDLDQWGTSAPGMVESVSLSSTISNGVATYPIVISADNTEGTLQVNSNINYRLTASQSDNCLVLPIQAVRTVGLEDGSMATVVYIKAGSQPENAIEVPFVDEEIPAGFYPVPVEIGIQDNYNVEIKSGVEEGAEVFTQIQSMQAYG